MQVHQNLNNLPAFKNAVITIGTFDGVHKGHVKIIEQLKAAAAKINGETIIITFYPHPRKIITNKTGEVKLLTTLDEKIALLNLHNIDHLIIINFNAAFAAQTADEYVTDFLYKKFKPHTLIIGHDHKFGAGRKGDYHLLEDYGKQLGFAVTEIDEQVLNEVTISSTNIRKALLHEDVASATEFLGYPYFFSGKVIEGDRIGRTIGYPTANMHVRDEDKLIPANGIYAVTIDHDIEYLDDYPKPLKGMLYIGNRPVVNGTQRVIEINIFDFNEDIYSQTLSINVHAFIRADKDLKNLNELKQQLKEDEIAVRDYLKTQN